MKLTKKIPQRKCIACGEAKDKKDLLRVIKNKEGQIHLDLSGKMNGRGAYICSNPDCAKEAIQKKKLNHSLKSNIPDDLIKEILDYVNEN